MLEIVIDDGANDNTVSIAGKTSVKVITNEYNTGKEASLKKQFLEC